MSETGRGRRRTVVGALALVASLVGATVACTTAAPTPARPTGSAGVVKLADGSVQGDLVNGTRRFLAIPYAKPPVGALRWKAPQPNDPWTGVRHQTSWASPCPQP